MVISRLMYWILQRLRVDFSIYFRIDAKLMLLVKSFELLMMMLMMMLWSLLVVPTSMPEPQWNVKVLRPAVDRWWGCTTDVDVEMSIVFWMCWKTMKMPMDWLMGRIFSKNSEIREVSAKQMDGRRQSPTFCVSFTNILTTISIHFLFVSLLLITGKGCAFSFEFWKQFGLVLIRNCT